MKTNKPVNQDNIVLTYIPIPIEALQSNAKHPNQSYPISQNYILKKWTDKKYSIIDAAQIFHDTNIVIDDSMPDNSTNLENKTRDEFSNTLLLNGRSDEYVQNNVRYLNYKIETVKKPGRPKSKNESLRCTICGDVFNKNITYRKHLETHRNVKRYKCNQCSESYNIEDNFKLHMAIHEKGSLKCPLCDRKFQRLASLKSHLMLHQVDETFTCKECLAEFETENEYDKHINSHDKETIKLSQSVPYTCSYCNYVFEDSKEYKEHVSYHVKIKKLVFSSRKCRRQTTNNKEYEYKCEICDKSFAKRCLLERHSRIHSGEKPFPCTKCNKAFAQKGTLQIHLFKHSGIKPYKCTLCPAEYFQKGNLRVHVEKTHTAPQHDDKLYKCTQCTCIYRKVASLNAHITKAHGGFQKTDELTELKEQLRELENISIKHSNKSSCLQDDSEKDSAKSLVKQISNPNETLVKLAGCSIDGSVRRYVVKQRKIGDVKWFICSYCTKEFKKPSDLIRHIRVHTREKPYKCTRCGRSFALKSTLLSHMNTHFNRRDYKCITCMKMFTSPRTLNVHLRKHEHHISNKTFHYKCSTCDKLFKTYEKVTEHMTIHDVTVDNNKTINSKDLYIVMKQPMLETSNGLVSVPAPKIRITNMDVTQYKNRPYTCHICNAKFIKSVHLKRHIMTHTGEKNYKCDICAKSFYTAYALKEHVQFHSNIKNFVCKTCSRRFTTKYLLKRHQVKHTTLKPYVCPYCKNKFKTVSLCRRHINIHKRDINIQIHALTETAELTELENDERAKIIDLSDTLSENPFGLSPINECTLDLTNVSNNTTQDVLSIQDTNVNTKQVTVPQKNKSTNRNKRKIKKAPSERKSALKFESQDATVISKNMMEENINGIQGNLSQDFISHLSANTQIFIDESGNYRISETGCTNSTNGGDIDVMQHTQENGQMEYSTIYISYDEFVNSDLYNSLIPPVKMENNDPILMSAINEPQDSNILFMDPTLGQNCEYQVDSQSFESFNMFNTNISVGDLNLAGNNVNVSLSQGNLCERIIDCEQTVLPSINEINITNQIKLNYPESSLQNGHFILKPTNIENDNLIVTNDLNYFPGVSFNLNQSNSDMDNMNSTMNTEIENCFPCSICKIIFNTLEELGNHQCIDMDNSNSNNKTEFIEIALEKNLESFVQSDNTVVPDFNDQVETAQIEITSEEPEEVDLKLHDKKQHKCTECEKSFDKKSNLLKHFVIHKNKKVENKCDYCEKTFKKPSDLRRHIRTHTGEKPFVCDHCDKKFCLKSTLQSHLRTHIPGGSKEYNCHVCNTNFSFKASLRTHMLIHTGVQPYPCHLCPAKFRTWAHRKSHLTTHLKNIGKKPAETRNKNSVKVVSNYVESVLSTEQVKIESNINQNVLLQDSLPIENSESDEIIESLKLEILKQLQNSGLLLQDSSSTILDSSMIEIDTSNYQEKQFREEENDNCIENSKLDDLTPTVQPKSKNFECEVCHKSYISKTVLRKHQKLHINGLSCAKCGKCFNSKDLLDRHVKLHSGQRPFACKICDNTFSEEGSLKTHVKRIHNII